MVKSLEQRVKPQILVDAEAELPILLRQEGWNGAKIYSSPKVNRVYRAWREGFLFLHLLHEDPEVRSSLHKHYGNMWVMLNEGRYEMDIAMESREKPTAYVRQEIETGEWYFMGPNDWHRIRPITKEIKSVVVVQDWIPPVIADVMGEWMTTRALEQHLEMFREYY